MSAFRLTDNRPAVRARYREAARRGVDAAANVLEREVKKAHNDYYTSGAFRGTVGVRQSIRRTSPQAEPRGWSARVGTNKKVALYWELGHFNIFTRKYERVRLWEPTALQQVKAMRDTFERVVKRYMSNG